MCLRHTEQSMDVVLEPEADVAQKPVRSLSKKLTIKADAIYPSKKSTCSDTARGQRKKDHLHHYNKISLLCRSCKTEHISGHFRDVRFIRQRVRAVGLNNGKGVKGVSKMTQQ